MIRVRHKSKEAKINWRGATVEEVVKEAFVQEGWNGGELPLGWSFAVYNEKDGRETPAPLTSMLDIALSTDIIVVKLPEIT